MTTKNDKIFVLTRTHGFFPFLESSFMKNTYPVTVQLLAIDYPTLLSLTRKSYRWPKPTNEIEALEKWQNRVSLGQLTERDIFRIFGPLQVSLWYFWKIFLTKYLEYLVWRWTNLYQYGNKHHKRVGHRFFCKLGLFFLQKNWKLY